MRDIDFNSKEKPTLNYLIDCDLENENNIIISNPYNEFSVYDLDCNFEKAVLNYFSFNLKLSNLNEELSFKTLLENNKIPYLYTGNGLFAIETDKKKFRKVDFLVNLRGFGRVIFDLKCREKVKFYNSDTKYFSILTSEIQELKNLQADVSLPLWISFSDKNLVDKKEKTIFYLVSISTIEKFWKNLRLYFDDLENFKEIKILRIPNEFFIKSECVVSLESEQNQIDEKILNDFSKKIYAHNKKIKEELILFIKKNDKYLKSKIAKKLSKEKLFFCSEDEINEHLDRLIVD